MLFTRCLSFTSLLICVSVDYPPTSPCRQYFTYRFDTVWIGRVTVPTSKYDLPVVTRVSMRLKAILKTKYVGLIELTEPPEISLDNIINKDSNRINYTVRFPLPSPLPTVKSIEVNNVTLCYSSPDTADLIVTEIVLQHKFPANGIQLHIGESSHKISKWRKICGKSSPNLLLPDRPSEWPWLVAILAQNSFGLEFLCSGNLVTDRHILTAHCVQNYVYGDYTRDVVVYLGKHDLTKWGEPSSQIRKSKKIKIHREFDPSTYTADLAVLTLASPVSINDIVRPVCLWSGDSYGHPTPGSLGMGGGRILTQAKSVHTHVTSSCHSSTRTSAGGIAKDLTEKRPKKYCAPGFAMISGSGPCNGDSGSGLLISRMNEENEMVWELRGVLSISLLDPLRQSCDLSNYLLFTDAAKFHNWIESIIFEDD